MTDSLRPKQLFNTPAIYIVDLIIRKTNVFKSKRDGKSPLLGLTYHHEAGEGSAFDIAKYHVNNLGWDHIGYTWVIENDGVINQTLDLDEVPYHAGWVAGDDLAEFPNKDKQYYNDHYLAVCLVGDFTKRLPTAAQLKSAAILGYAFKKATAGLGELVGHNELPGKTTACPGQLDMNYIRAEVDRMMEQGSAQAPSDGDDPFFKKFATWRDAAINAKGVADNFGQELVGARDEVNRAIRALEPVIAHLKVLLERLERVTGGKAE